MATIRKIDTPAQPEQVEPRNPHGTRKRLFKIILILVIVFGVLFVIGWLPRLHQNSQNNKAAKSAATALPAVSTTPVQRPPANDVLTLPGNIEAIQQTAVTARASGYIQKWLVDIGDPVRAGQTMALISVPDLQQEVRQAQAQVSASQAALAEARANLSNQRANVAQAYANLSRSDATLAQAQTQLSQAKAALAQAQQNAAQQGAQVVQAQANLDLARVTAQRYLNLLAEGAIDRQTTDQEVASYKTNLANVAALQSALRASQANVAAYRDAVGSSRANVSAYAEGVRASKAAVTAAQANVTSAQANVAASADNVQSNRANYLRTAVLTNFRKVTAPFSGVVTARNVDNGALISASGTADSGTDSTTVGSGSAGTTSTGNAAGGSATGSGSAPGGGASGQSSGGASPTSLFSIAQINMLRIYISVPQSYVSMIRVGQAAQLLVSEFPGKPFMGRVTRTAAALDAATRTLVTEVDVANPQGLLRPGMFAEVRLRVPHPGNSLLIPDSAMVSLPAGTEVVTVTNGNKLRFQPITVGRDFGTVMEVTSGLNAGEQIVTTPNDSMTEGETVHPVAAPPAKPSQ